MDIDNLREVFPSDASSECPICKIRMEVIKNEKGLRLYECEQCHLRVSFSTRRDRWLFIMTMAILETSLIAFVLGVISVLVRTLPPK